MQINLLSVDNTDWQTNVSITMGKKEKKHQMNLLNADNRNWQINVILKKEKLQMNLLHVDERNCKHIKSVE